jgi:hypothetical protein
MDKETTAFLSWCLGIEDHHSTPRLCTCEYKSRIVLFHRAEQGYSRRMLPESLSSLNRLSDEVGSRLNYAHVGC